MTQKPNPDEIAYALSKDSGTVQAVPPDGPYKQPGRTGKTAINSWHDPAVAQQLKMLAVEKGMTQQKLIAEGLNMVFAKYGKPQIA